MLQWILSSSVLIVFVLLVRFAFRTKISLRLRYALWLFVMLRLLIPVDIGSSVISLSNVTEMAAKKETVWQQADQIETSDNSVPAASESRTSAKSSKESLPVREASGKTVGTILKIVWAGGIVLVFLSFFTANIRFMTSLKKERRRYEVENYRLPVYVSSGIDSPCLSGLIHPAVYLTEEVIKDKRMLDFVLTHEYMHFLHGDAVWSFIRLFCIALHWYNPLVWIAAVLSRNDGEMACDEGTIKRIGETERKTYGQMLIRMSCREKPVLQLAGMAICGSKKTMKGRILMINRKPGNTVLSVILIAVLMAAAVGCTFTGADKPAKTLRKVPVKETLEWGCTGDDIAKVFGAPQEVVTEGKSTVFKYTGNIETDLGTMTEINFHISEESDHDGLYCITGIVAETTYEEMEKKLTACYGETPEVTRWDPTDAAGNSDGSHRENYSWDSLKLSKQLEEVQEKIREEYETLGLSGLISEDSDLVSVYVVGGPEQDGKYDVGINLDASLYIMGYISQ